LTEPERRNGGEGKPVGYYASVRRDILPLMPQGAGRLLDIGCGEGATAAFLKQEGYCRWACGLELFPEAAATAMARLDQVIKGDIETMKIPLEPGSLDVILCLDILEHLVDPWRAIGKLRPLLAPGGVVIASIPNIRCLKVLAPLLFLGRFQYRDQGLLDRTHLRFFTRRTAIELIESAGLGIRLASPRLGRYGRIINALTLSVFSEFLAPQYFIVGAHDGSKYTPPARSI